jgi:UDP-N-acetylglucosamine 2-epimerase (non-hydrolysing)
MSGSVLKVLSVFGTRPEAIKMAPVVRLLRETPGIDARVCVTGQHREMLGQVLELFEITPDWNLDVMRPDQDLTSLTAAVLEGMKGVLAADRPDRILVHGDTSTTLATSLAGYYAKVPVAHVEAGLRTRNIYSPWPEEINRRVAGVIADLHFAPTARARQALLDEATPADRVVVTGNTVIDALLHVSGLMAPTRRSAPGSTPTCRRSIPPSS